MPWGAVRVPEAGGSRKPPPLSRQTKVSGFLGPPWRAEACRYALWQPAPEEPRPCTGDLGRRVRASVRLLCLQTCNGLWTKLVGSQQPGLCRGRAQRVLCELCHQVVTEQATQVALLAKTGAWC